PAIHIETAGGKWEYLPTTKSEDAALVLYANHPTKGVTEMILAGFSGRSTGCIALEFPRLANELWAGRYEQDDLKLGVFLLRFKFDRNAPQCPSGSRTIIEHSNCEVIALDKEVIRRRLKPLADTTNQSTPA
ncbi:MAG: hypothetical protein U9N87_03720, partial [Planctomycetota bacterium]|nr:hypothetical protein [Planctomycetota bacterium]